MQSGDWTAIETRLRDEAAAPEQDRFGCILPLHDTTLRQASHAVEWALSGG